MGTAAAAGASPLQAGSLRFKSSPKAKPSGNLVDHGGQITPASDTYAVFWGPTSAWSSDVFSGIASLFSGFGGSNYLGIAQQYMRGAAIGSTYDGAKFDSSAPPKTVNAATLGAEVVKEYGSLDPNGIYFVYTSNFPNGGNYCAWHSFTTENGQNVAVAYMPNPTGVAGCQTGNTFNLSQSATLSALANVTAHEFMEAVTDTWPGSGTYAWIDGSGSEIGDKCAWQFSSPVTLSNKTTWQLQEEWSNAITGCAQG
jgi:serine protease